MRLKDKIAIGASHKTETAGPAAQIVLGFDERTCGAPAAKGTLWYLELALRGWLTCIAHEFTSNCQSQPSEDRNPQKYRRWNHNSGADAPNLIHQRRQVDPKRSYHDDAIARSVGKQQNEGWIFCQNQGGPQGPRFYRPVGGKCGHHQG